MIDKVVIRNWKRFGEIEFDLRSKHMILVGPNNCGKTSVLQAIAAWGFALHRWRQANVELNQRNGWQALPITLEQFTPVSVREFNALWRDRIDAKPITVSVSSGIQRVAMTFEADKRSPFQMFVRPTHDTKADAITKVTVPTLFVPSMTGLQVEEPVLTRAKIDQLLGRNRPGEVLRNLVATVASDEDAWTRLCETIRRLFGVEMLPPDATGADIVAEYQHSASSARFDLASAGSGFQQVLMLLAFLETQERTVLLLDEPDAHLHVFLQERIVEVLRTAATRSRSLLIVATHSEVVLDTVEHDEVCVLFDKPMPLVNDAGKATLKDALRVIDHNDLAKALEAPGVLYVEDYSDLSLLREWARVLQHPAEQLLGPHVYWKKVAQDLGFKRPGISAEDHFAALRLEHPDYPGFQLVDGDSKVQGPKGEMYGTPPKCRWPRYEIESYLLHPDALERFVSNKVGPANAKGASHALRAKMSELLTPEFVADPMRPTMPAQSVLQNVKARTELVRPILNAGGVIEMSHLYYHEIAAQMLPAEIHSDVRFVLDSLCKAFGIR